TVAYLHETCAPYLLGQDPLRIERHARALIAEVGNHFAGYPSRSVEVRSNSAVDLALWDLFGKATGLPLYQLLGGLSRDRIRIYNTCASAAYNRTARTESNTLLVRPGDSATSADPLDDLAAQHQRPGELAVSLLEDGIGAMKVWPFDAYALASGGQHISAEDLGRGVRVVEAIRAAVGDRIDVMLEYHGLWQLPAALQIAAALADYDIYWHEDPVAMHRLGDLARYKERVNGRVAGSENLGTTSWYREAFGRGAIDVAHYDMAWIGGLTEGRKVAALAEAFDRPIAPHDCTGPVTLVANLHLTLAAPNALVLETVRSYTRGFYRDLVTTLPRIENGYAYPLTGPGLGTALDPDLRSRSDATVRRSAAGG
ncbi:MAG TPA: mandelate racemase/muconate lactonizing enzyme family protein, partial [Geminicoccaceae bacterium]|nr:mandelate racemase/muconate lactonizing enzyme family protein [Geminicoccaceae bacterium]